MENKIKKLIKDFYKPLDREGVRNLFFALYTQQNIKEANKVFIKNKDYINTLQKRFKHLVVLRNKLAKNNKYNNFWEYVAAWDKIPRGELNSIDKKSLKTIKKISTSLPKNYKGTYWFNTIYNNLNYQFFTESNLNIPQDILNTFIKKHLCKIGDLSQIAFVKSKTWSASTEYNNKKNKIYIKYDPAYQSYETAIAIAHELGHALQGSKKLNTYKDEKEAIAVELKYIKTLPKNIQKTALTGKLLTYTIYFFEKEIYTNPNQDFAEAYAKSIKKIHPEITINSNPLYIFNTHLVDYPCYSTVYVSIYNKLLKS